MCLGVPGRVIEIQGPVARVDVAGAKKNISLALLRGVCIGDYVIIHAGYAIEKINRQRAEETLSLMRGLAS